MVALIPKCWVCELFLVYFGGPGVLHLLLCSRALMPVQIEMVQGQITTNMQEPLTSHGQHDTLNYVCAPAQ